MSKPAAQHLVELLARLSLRARYRVDNEIAWLVRITRNQVSRQIRENIRVRFGNVTAAANG